MSQEKTATPLRIQYRNISELKIDDENARTHSQEQVERLAQSIRTFGFNTPILVDGNFNVIAGHGRVAACKLLKIPQVPTIALEHLSEAQIRAFGIADNRLAELGTWNEQNLAGQLTLLSRLELDFPLEATGFDAREINLMIDEPVRRVRRKRLVDKVSKLRMQEQATDDLWLLGDQRLLCCDPTHTGGYKRLMNGQHAAVAFIDLTQHTMQCDNAERSNKSSSSTIEELSGSNFTKFLQTTFARIAGNTSTSASHFVFADWARLHAVLTAGLRVFAKLAQVCILLHERTGASASCEAGYELVLIFKKGQVETGDKGGYSYSLVWRNSATQSNYGDHDRHAELIGTAIENSTAEGEIVLDCFSRGGATVIAAEASGRRCYAIEPDPQLVDRAIRRWQRFTGNAAIHMASGRPFDDIAEALGEHEKGN